MKILLATYWGVPHVGGVWNYMKQLCKQLELLGHEVDLLGYDKDGENIHIPNRSLAVQKKLFINQIRNKYPTLYLDYIVHHFELQGYFFQLATAYLGLNKYDIIHTQDVISSVSINKVKPKKTALVATLHGCVAHEIKQAYYISEKKEDFVSDKGGDYFDQLEHNGATAAVYTIVANEWLKKILTDEYHVPAEQFKVMHYGYDIESFLQRMKTKSINHPPTNKKVIIYTGRLAEFKGVHYLISALSQLKKIRNDWVCWIAGVGPQQEELQEQCKTLELEHDVFFLGSRDDIPSLLSLSDILVLPTLIENQPLSVIEAQIAGKAIIASDVGGIPEIIKHGRTGVLTPAGDVQMLSLHLDYLLEHEPYRRNLGANAQKWAFEHWPLDRAVQSVLNVYEDAIIKNQHH